MLVIITIVVIIVLIVVVLTINVAGVVGVVLAVMTATCTAIILFTAINVFYHGAGGRDARRRYDRCVGHRDHHLG